ncbi:MAG: InlB B-repeat-containing protein [Lachnospiraceae bacterium]|nr:InlB B-repeat-containing protein [Lachnospiraceae bacterium]
MQQLKRTIIRLCLGMVLLLGVSGLAGTDVKAETWGSDSTNDTVRFTMQSRDDTHYQASFTEVYAGQKIEPLVITGELNPMRFESAFQQNSAQSGYEEYTSVTGIWSNASGTFKMGKKYRYRLVLSALNGNTMESGMRLNVCENNMITYDDRNYDSWTQNALNPYIFYSPVIECKMQNSWDTVAADQPGAVIKNDADNPCVDATKLIKDPVLLNAVKGMGKDSPINEDNSMYRYRAQQAVKSLTLTYNTDVGENMLKGIEYFPYLRNLTIKVNKKTNIKSLNLSKNSYLVHVYITNYVGGADESISLSSSLRTLQIYDSKTGKLSLSSMKKLYEFMGENLTVTSEAGYALDFSGCSKLEKLELTSSGGFYYVYVPTGGSLRKIDLDQSSDLRALSFDNMPYLYVTCSNCPNLSQITAKNVSEIAYILANRNDKLERFDLSGSVIGKTNDGGSVSASYNSNLKTFLAKGTTFENESVLEMHDDGFVGLNLQNPSSCNPIFKEGTKLKLYSNSYLTDLTLPATAEGCIMEGLDCSSCALTELRSGSVKPATRSFKCAGNKLTGTLKLSGILAAAEKWSVDCSGNDSLTGLDTTGIGTLKSLNVSSTGITSLTLDTVPANMTLKCDNCESLSKLDLKNGSFYSISAAGVKALKNVLLTNATVSSIVLSDSLVLQQHSFTNASVDSFSIKKCTTPESFTFGTGGKIGSLLINKCSGLKSLDVSGASTLTSLDCASNSSLETLITGDNLSLKTLSCSYCTSLSSIDVTGNIALTSLTCQSSVESGIVPISALDLSRNVNLETLNLQGCQLTKLDLGSNKKLKKLDVDATGLAKLDLKENPLLTTLECENCELMNLDLSQNRNLSTLKCAGNHLAALDLTGLSLNTKSIRNQTRDVTCLNEFLDFEALDSTMDIDKVQIESVKDASDNDIAYTKQDTGYKFLSGAKTIKYWYDTDYSTDLSHSSDKELMNVTMTITEHRTIPVVYFDACGGTVSPESALINKTTKTVELPTPVRADHKFEGWYASKNYAENTKVDDTRTYDRDTRLFAKWTYSPPVIPEYMIYVNATEGGTVTGGNETYKKGELVVLTAIPNKGYVFDHWQKDGKDIDGSGTIAVVVEDDAAYVAVFRQDWVKCTITVDATEGGSAKGGCTCIAGATVKLEAEPFEGYAFEKWQRFGIDTDKPASFELIAEGDEAWTAVFTKTGSGPVIASYTVRIFAEEGGTASGAGTFMENSNITVHAVADSGYEFTGWYDEEGLLLDDQADYTFAVEKDRDLTASFKKKPVTEDPKEDPKKEDPKKDDPKTDDPKTNDPKAADPAGQTPQGGNAKDNNAQPGIGTFSADGTTLTDPNGVTFTVAEKLSAKDLKKGALVADQKTGGKYRITKIVFKKGKFKSGTAEYIGPYNLNTEKINVPAKTKIGGNSFTVTGIAANVTKGCTKVTGLVIGANVTRIAKNAFNGCSTLKTIQIKSKKLTKIGKKAFGGIAKKATVKVPGKKKKAYKKLLQKAGLPKTAKLK